MMSSGLNNSNKAELIRQGFMHDFQKSLTRKQLLDLILLEHTYAKPASLDPDFNRIHSTNVLSFSKSEKKDTEENEQEDTGELDVLEVSKPEESLVGYDKPSAVSQMSELEQCFHALLKEETWHQDEVLSKVGWTRDQTKLYDQVLKVLSTYQLGRCTYKGNDNEEILRHVAINKAAKRFRYIAAGVTWDAKAMSWLHSVLIDGLNPSLFLCYLELLQALIAKVPSLVEKMIQNSTPGEDKNAILNSLPIMNCLKKQWDPAPQIISKKEKKQNPETKETSIENKPILFMLPRGPTLNLIHPKRFTFWQKQLSSIAKTAPINVHSPDKDTDFACSAYLENIIGVARTRISMSYSKCPGRPVILIGWSVGALLACQISLLESVAGIICLGYPCYGLDGLRQMDSDPCIDVKCPVMFVVGTHSATCSTSYIEALREKMRVDTRLLVIPGGDEVLKLTSTHKKRVKMTQNMVDRLIMDDVEDFISGLLAKVNQSKDITRRNTPSPGIQQLQVDGRIAPDRKRKHKKTDFGNEVIDKKKKKTSPFLQKPSVAAKKNTINMVYDASKAKGTTIGIGNVSCKEGIMTPSELTKAATRNMSSNAPSVDRITSERSQLSASPAIVSSLMNTNHSALDKNQMSKHGLKNQQAKINEKMLKKLKMTKKPLHMTRSPSPQSHVGLTAAQQFPTTSSILLSNSTAKVRLQDGRILCLQGTNASSTSSDSQTFISAMSSSTKPTAPIGVSSFSKSAHSAPQTMLPSQASTTIESVNQRGLAPMSFHTGKSLQATSFVGFTNLVNTSYVSTAHTLTKTTTDPKTVFSPSVTQSATSPTAVPGTHLTSSDLKYLAKLFEKSNENPNSTDAATTGKVQEKSVLIPTSPISAKIGIGTLTNLPNADGSPPGSGIRASPISKQLPAKESIEQLSPSTPEAPKMKALLTKHQSVGNKTSGFPKRDLFDQKRMINKNRFAPKTQSSAINAQTSTHQLKNLPVTVTIPTHNNSRGLAASSNSKSQSSSTVLKTVSTTSISFPSLLAQQRLILSSTSSSQQTTKPSVELSHLIRKVTPTSSSILDVVSNRQMSSSSKLTVTGRPIQTSPLSNRSPQTITLHIPNSAMLKDHGQLRKSGSEIKLIGLLNQKGRSPMTSPIHFSVQSRSAPGSPQAQSPTIVLTSRSDPPTPKASTSKTQETIDLVSEDSSPKDKKVSERNSETSTNADTPVSKAPAVSASTTTKEAKAVTSKPIAVDASTVIKDSKSVTAKPAPDAFAAEKDVKPVTTKPDSSSISVDSKQLAAKPTTNSMSAAKDTKTNTSKNIVSNSGPSKQSVKFSRPATVQTTLVRSLTAASLSPQQQESISTLLRNAGTKKSRGSASKLSNDSSKTESKEVTKNMADHGSDAEVNTLGKEPLDNQSVKIRHTDIDVLNGHIVSANDKSGILKSDQTKANPQPNQVLKSVTRSSESQLQMSVDKDVYCVADSPFDSKNIRVAGSEGLPPRNRNSERSTQIKSKSTTLVNDTKKFKECFISVDKIETNQNHINHEPKNQGHNKLVDNHNKNNGVNVKEDRRKVSDKRDLGKCNEEIVADVDSKDCAAKFSAADLSVDKSGEQKRRKRHREESDYTLDTCGVNNAEEDGPSASKKLAMKASVDNDRKKVSAPQKTEE